MKRRGGGREGREREKQKENWCSVDVVGIALIIQVRWLLLLVSLCKCRQIVSSEAFMRL